jgi:N-acetylneuraminate synthase
VSVYIIAEIGINHNGSITIAKQLIDMAKAAGCDAVKFQKRSVYICYTEEFLKQPRESPWGKTQLDQKMGLEFSYDHYAEIEMYCDEVGIDWFASAWDIPSLVFLQKFNMKHNKIASAMLTNTEFVKRVAEEKKHTFISTGMSTAWEVWRTVNEFAVSGCPHTVMHCTSAYPCPDNLCHLRTIQRLKDTRCRNVGYSGHESSPLPSVLAVAMGAVAIERHITLDRAMYGSDQAASLEKRGLELMVKDCRRVGSILGSVKSTILDEERDNAKKLRYFE